MSIKYLGNANKVKKYKWLCDNCKAIILTKEKMCPTELLEHVCLNKTNSKS